jgi:hypothetical protein
MNYETPELTALKPAINAIQVTRGTDKSQIHVADSDGTSNDNLPGYMDWED